MRGTLSFLAKCRKRLRQEARQAPCPLASAIETWERQAKRRYRLQRESGDSRAMWQDWEDYLQDRIVSDLEGSTPRFGYRGESGIQSDSPAMSESEIEEVLGYLLGIVYLSENESVVISLLCQGESFSAIANQVGIAERSVYRIVSRVRTLLFIVSVVFSNSNLKGKNNVQVSTSSTIAILQAITSISSCISRPSSNDGTNDGYDGAIASHRPCSCSANSIERYLEAYRAEKAIYGI